MTSVAATAAALRRLGGLAVIVVSVQRGTSSKRHHTPLGYI
jgi:hypothetical protein